MNAFLAVMDICHQYLHPVPLPPLLSSSSYSYTPYVTPSHSSSSNTYIQPPVIRALSESKNNNKSKLWKK